MFKISFKSPRCPKNLVPQGREAIPGLLPQEHGFTLIEIVIIIVVLGILGSVAIVRYRDMSWEAKEAACKESLKGLRGAISLWNVKQIAVTGSENFPPIDSLRTQGVVLASPVPPNPYQSADKAPDSIVVGVTPGVVVGDRGGWAYKESTGEIWANTSSLATSSGGGGCDGGGEEESVGENGW